ncbi:glycosyltransferase family 2 protein [Gilvimarinus xylanilyticus]|uniref:Glycosyltransferase n=1 Tax=Gilvimarinus xylanilyticus TaxID=2944139 RepID=A0A9X2KWR6_9GAMM|nr:glycosyltransferase [Gilvimarinus xylanilyticus]MCP8899355.1 glycosyltransferase [Gilvimarinus xylanilyticus]
MASEREISIIVPVYQGLKQTKKCLESVLLNGLVGANIVLINDSSPNSSVRDYCRQLASHDLIILSENDRNLGFVGSVNKGMQLAGAKDVVLLNSDTIVSAGWLSALRQAAYRSPQVGTVTPFSNNATVCSYPLSKGDNALLPGLSVMSMQGICAEVASGDCPELPTGVGFCMYIRRDCLDDVGYFDEEAFGKGYGEENDFCLRASANGWKHLLAPDCFVYHEGGVSFSDQKQALVANAEKVIAERYPGYFDDVKKFIQQDPIRPFRDRIDAEIYRRGGEAAAALWALRAQEYRSRSN